ncbi:MAG: UDP-N-acetylmuramoyl-L-alanine--D-glutamate ligase [Kiritimatiellales bacterium]|nr:UDP-N-acetylmuramoyl-L-alanine--D-glutamate ligase [Kiritimatiellota bacterium]MBL7011815.1 UDP-N-acetylmuramoyl-L-alanine--D-glutamate ligase [Kiritimatiellales bacterium]
MHNYEKALILGCGRSGQAAEALLRGEGTQTLTLDEADCDFSNFKLQTANFNPDVAIISPGFSLKHPWLKDLAARGVPLLSELELGWSRRQCPVIAVTGSNGKSTVVKWIANALSQAGQTAVPCGNYGLPISTAVMLPEVPDWLLVEVSSFQLETVQEFHPQIGVLLNVLPNHLDRHGDMETYRALKLRLFERMNKSDTAIIPYNFEVAGFGNYKTFGIEEGADYRFLDGKVGAVDLSGTYFDNEVLGAAAAAVVAVGEACGIPAEVLESSAKNFEPLPHRMQTVAGINGVRFVDDSKATNLAAMCAALRMSRGRVHLIAGGRAKESDFSFAKDLLAQQVFHLYLIGEASTAMQSAWKDCVQCFPCQTLEQAVFSAWECAEPGDTVLLSPACTSFDQFCSFAERGAVFAREVNRLAASDVKA